MNACGGGYLPHRFSRKNGYDNPSVYCDDLYSMFENMQSVLESHLYVTKSDGDRLRCAGRAGGRVISCRGSAARDGRACRARVPSGITGMAVRARDLWF